MKIGGEHNGVPAAFSLYIQILYVYIISINP